MSSATDICSLDYLIGTLSTAYKGIITSLVVKDFCMTETGSTVTLRGTVLAMPAGNYEASLIQKGIQLSRTVLEEGYFELRADADRVKQAGDLQIDVIQSGRHIGTFLVKKETGGAFYLSAVELSGELKGVDLKLLTAPVRERVGLLRKAEAIITRILSTKKEWPDLSEKLNSYAGDLFWASRSGFYEAFPILVHFMVRAAERNSSGDPGKTVTNVLGLMELPLEQDPGNQRAGRAAEIWLKKLTSSSIDLAGALARTAVLLRSVHDRFPGVDAGPALARLTGSLRDRLASLPALNEQALAVFRKEAAGASALFEPFTPEARNELSSRLSRADASLQKGNLAAAIDLLVGLNPEHLDDAKMVFAFTQAASMHVTPDSSGEFTRALSTVLSLHAVLSARALEALRSDVPVFLRKLVSFSRHEPCANLLSAVSATGSPLKEEVLMNPVTAKAVLESGSSALVERYTDLLTGIIIPAPRVREVSAETWAEKANPGHLERLGKFMDLLELGDDRFREVLVHVIANLAVTGVFIPDDRLFQRRISSYLNSPAMHGRFLLNYLFLQLLPVYYHEVGAVSRIRDYSTEIDAWGNDPLLYFLRKQVHVNASNYNVRLIERIIAAWTFNDPSRVQNVVPPDVYSSLNPELFARYSPVMVSFLRDRGVLDRDGLHFEKLPELPDKEFAFRSRNGQLDEVPGKVMLLCLLYREVVNKYSLERKDVPEQEPDMAVAGHVERMRTFAGILLDPGRTEALESLYFKRHIAFGIPSVLGTYHEPKFDALGEFLRTGSQVRLALERAIAGAGDAGFSPERAAAWLRLLVHSAETLELQGLENMQIEEFCAIMRENTLSLSQAADLLRMWQKELAWMVDFFSRTFSTPLARILRSLPPNELPEQLQGLDRSQPDYFHKAGDILIRNLIAAVPGLTESDRMIERVIQAFSGRREPQPVARGRSGGDTVLFEICRLDDRDIARSGPMLGAKAKNLAYLHSRGFRVPCGATLSAVLTPGVPGREKADDLPALIRKAVQAIEAGTGRGFGNARKPLFLSVRSGSYVSMPGILSTILYCGMNEETVRGYLMETGDRRLVFDSYRRFVEQYSTVVLGIEMRVFDRLRAGLLPAKRDSFSLIDPEEIVTRYLDEIAGRGLAVPEDPYEQLERSVSAIYASWYGSRARLFRQAMKTSDEWGTSVTLMEMIPGNRAGSGASVFFTRNPFTREEQVYGETRENATGDDLVLGRQLNRPLSAGQSGTEGPGRAGESLEERDPVLFRQHRELARAIEQAMGGLPQEVEAAYVRQPDGSTRIYVLQTRRMEFNRNQYARFDEICSMESRIIGRGAGAYGGAVSGVVTLARTPEQALKLKRETGMPLVLLRTTANTDDVSLMPVISGIVTATGGVTSHAAVLARKFEINAVVACTELSIIAGTSGRILARIGETVLPEGALISIDGSTGLVFSGSCFSVESGRSIP